MSPTKLPVATARKVAWDSTQLGTYRRLAAMDPPALRWLIIELVRASEESAALAAQNGTAEAVARATRHAQRASDAQAALALVKDDG
jgi:hypothetical protein